MKIWIKWCRARMKMLKKNSNWPWFSPHAPGWLDQVPAAPTRIIFLIQIMGVPTFTFLWQLLNSWKYSKFNHDLKNNFRKLNDNISPTFCVKTLPKWGQTDNQYWWWCYCKYSIFPHFMQISSVCKTLIPLPLSLSTLYISENGSRRKIPA